VQRPDRNSISTDVLVIGAGPAGAAAAISLARRSVDVLLVDRSEFPRDKVCGDALIPDALAALDALGLRDAVLTHARRLEGMEIHAPSGRAVRLKGECAVVPRLVFDNLLRDVAVAAGARFLAPYRAVAPVVRTSRCVGATFRHPSDGSALEVEARWTILATGAASDVLRAFGVADRMEASATAARVYLEMPALRAPELPFLIISVDRHIAPGYGWLFPGPGGMLNVGVGVFHDATRRPGEANLRTIMARFLETFEPTRDARAAAASTTRFMGAPLRTGLTGAQLSKPGLLVAGEAAGTTYSFSGEGIGKALATGMLAADVVSDALERGEYAEAAAAQYARRVETTFRDRFRAYKIAQDYLQHPRVADFLAWRANAGSFARAQLEGMFTETVNPKQLFSVGGLVRALLT
jgi:menaquinone-9 beta-reductase